MILKSKIDSIDNRKLWGFRTLYNSKIMIISKKADKCKSTARDEIIFTFNASNQVESSTSFVSTQYSRMEFAHTTNLPPFEQFLLQ